MSSMKIDDWRAKIDAIDVTLLNLLNARARFALKVGRLKGKSGLALRVPAREREILLRMLRLNPGPLDAAAVKKIYQRILDESIRLQVQHGVGHAALPKASVAKSLARKTYLQKRPRKTAAA